MEGLGRGVNGMKKHSLTQSVVRVVAGFALLWACLYCFVFPYLVGGGPGKVSIACNDERQLLLSIEGYKREFGSYPTGENTSIVRVLTGDNPRKLKLIYLSTNSTNGCGEFVDPWKTAYKIVFEGTNRVAISSAGIDRIFGDADDIIIIFNSVSNDFVKP